MPVFKGLNSTSDLDYPTITPTLDLNFALTKTLDPRITFTRNSIGTYVGSDGYIKTAVANEPRFEHDPATGKCLGLLIETSRTNLVTNSDQALFGTLTGITRVLNAGIAPDGTQTASLLQEDNGNNTHQQEFSGTLQNRTFSIFVKPAGRTRFRIYSANQNPFAAFLLTESGSVTAVNSATARIESYPNGWYRCSLASTVLDLNKFYFGPIDTAVTYPSTWASSYTGDGVSGVYVWGAQLEAGDYPTSYIPTSGSTVTRAADIANITGTNFSSWYNSSKEGTLYFDTTLKSEFEDVPNLMIVALSRGAATGGQIGFDTVGLWGSAGIRNFDTVGYLVPGTNWGWNNNNYFNYSINPSSKNKYAVGFKVGTSSSNLAINGTLLGSKNTTFNNVSGLYFGTNGVSQTISRITYYPKRLPDYQLRLLTQN